MKKETAHERENPQPFMMKLHVRDAKLEAIVYQSALIDLIAQKKKPRN